MKDKPFMYIAQRFNVGDTVRGFTGKPTNMRGKIIKKRKLRNQTEYKVMWESGYSKWHSPISIIKE